MCPLKDFKLSPLLHLSVLSAAGAAFAFPLFPSRASYGLHSSINMRALKSVLLLTTALATTNAASDASFDCGVACPQVLSPVCASDGTTYNNECEFEVAKHCTLDDDSLVIVSEGACPTATPTPTPTPSVCSGEVACPQVLDPVCGSDGVTYDNECSLGLAQCTNPSLTLVSSGACTFTTTPTPTPLSTPDCGYACPAVQDLVCGSDGKTYNSECDLDFARDCSKGGDSLVVVSKGACPTSTPTSAPSNSPSVSPTPTTATSAPHC